MVSITDYVKEGLKYPFNDGRKVLIFGLIILILNIFSFLMEYFVFDSIRFMSNSAPITTIQAAFAAVPQNNIGLFILFWIMSLLLLIFIEGYHYDVIKYSIERKYELPEFSDIKRIFLNGIRTFIVLLAYSIFPFILFLLGMMLSVNQNVGGAVNSIGVLIILISFIFAVFCTLLEIIALSNMIANDELGAAFRFKEILSLIKNIGWGKYIGVLLFTFIVVLILLIFLGFILSLFAFGISVLISSAIAGALITMIINSILIYPYIDIVLGRIYGSLYSEAVDG